jgi:hypothetical protein
MRVTVHCIYIFFAKPIWHPKFKLTLNQDQFIPEQAETSKTLAANRSARNRCLVPVGWGLYFKCSMVVNQAEGQELRILTKWSPNNMSCLQLDEVCRHGGRNPT